MPQSGRKYTNLESFLRDHKCPKGEKYSHTRIGSPKLNIYGGSYKIPDKSMSTFWKLYYKKVFVDKKLEFLTEAQNIDNGGPLLIDIDMKYPSTVTERKHDLSEIFDILQLYIESIKHMFNIQEEYVINAWVFEKDKVNILKDQSITKDGIHIVFGLSMDHNIQRLLRDTVMEKEKLEYKIFSEDNLNCKNNIDDIFDISISRGSTNWQVWGSRKPGCDAYKMTHISKINISENDMNIDIEAVKEQDLDISKMLPMVSAQHQDFHKLDHTMLKTEYKTRYLNFQSSNGKKKKKKITKKSKQQNDLFNTNHFMLNVNQQFPTNKKELETVIDIVFNSLEIKDYGLREIHEIVMCFDENYYNPFDKWIQMGWALHNTHDILFWTWMLFSSKSDKFDYDDIKENMNKWNNMREDGYSFRSIYYWANENFPQDFKRIRDESITKFLWGTINSLGADNDLAILAEHIFKGQYACISIKHNKWYHFNGTRWKQNDSGTSLRYSLSHVIAELYVQQCYTEKENSVDEKKTAEERDKHLQNSQIFNKIALKLKEAPKKNAIMQECKEQFYDEQLTEKLDADPYLLGFDNGVYDFQQKKFRKGEPEDYISFSTKTNYVPFDKNNKEHITIKKQIDEFMFQIFPDEGLRRYMWEHAASTLIGNNRNQKFNIYTGSGGNGKSKYINLLNGCLGDYADKLNIALITQRRKAAGGPSPEIAKLKGKRYITMDEPTKGDVLNEGIVKQLTGGDEITARELYTAREIKFTPQFELTCCTNNMFEVNSTDKGIWRRIRKCDYRAEFIDEDKYIIKRDNGQINDPDYPIYIKDYDMDDKIETWLEVFTALLIEIVNETEGKVKDCELVLEASRAYQEGQNFYAQFIKEKLIKGTPTDKIKKNDIRNEFNEWYQQNYQKKPPKFRELCEYLDKAIGKYSQSGRCWWGYRINYDAYASDEESSD